MPPAVPFFSEIVAQCPQLERVELYGRRFDSSLVNMLPPETLRRLSLSIPNEDVRGQFVDELIAQIEAGKWPHLQRYFFLSARSSRHFRLTSILCTGSS